MAKSESTAVNQLISLVQGSPSRRDEPSEDLFGPPKGRVAPPRMSATVPPLRGAADVAPLPPQRAPTGTSQLDVNKPVRMVTAPPSRATSIPPLPQTRAASPGAGKLPPPNRGSMPPAPQRASAPPPRPSPAQATGTPPPVLQRTAQPATTPPPPTAQRAPASPRPTPARAQPAQPEQPAKARGTGPQRTTPPTTTPVAAPFDAGPERSRRAEGTTLPTGPSPGHRDNPIYPGVRAAIDRTGDEISADNWFEASRMVEKIDETYVGTRPAPRREGASETLKKIMLPLVVLSVVSAGVAYVVFSHHAKKVAPPVTHVAAPAAKIATAPATVTPAAPSTESSNAATATAGGTQPEPPAPGAAPAAAPIDDQVAAHPNANEVKIVAKGSSDSAPAAAAPAAPAPAAKVAAITEAAPVVHEVPTSQGMIKLVDVRIDSKPAGATVMLVDNGKTSFLGTTPVAASVDPTRSYDVVLTLEGRPTQMAHLDPNKAQKLEVTLSKTGAKAETPRAARSEAPKTESAPKIARKHHVAASAPTGGLADPGFDAPAAPKADAGGEGTLMVSSKPPCEIWIDGKDTGLMTPQRAMSLPAGAHKVTFSNTDENITKTVGVMITADQSTKLIQNLMQ